MEENNNSKNTVVRILVVDDSLLMHKLIKKVVETAGFEVCATAINGKQAVEMYEQYVPDVITMDINMPIMDGIEATRRIKSLNPNVKVIFLGSGIDKNVLEQANELGVKYFVDKPFEKDKLLEALHASIDGRQIEVLPKQPKNKEISNTISPFFKAVEEVFNCMLNIDAKINIMDEQKELFETGGYSAVLGFTGKVSGWFVLNMSADTAWKIAERINRESFENKNDSFIGYSVQELANIICGNAITKINNTERNLKLRLTPPGLFRGMSMSILVYSLETYQGIMKTELGYINVHVVME